MPSTSRASPTTPPPEVREVGSLSVPPAVPESETAPLSGETPPPSPEEVVATALPLSPYADELPPNFWDEVELPEVLPAREHSTQRRADGFAGDASGGASTVQPPVQPPDQSASDSAPPKTRGRAPSERLEDDPRFTALQQLFPGRVVAWQAHALPVAEELEVVLDESNTGRGDDGGNDPDEVDSDNAP